MQSIQLLAIEFYIIREHIMRVFVTGATGFIGSVVVRELIDAGHKVLGLARSDASAAALVTAGAAVHRGTLDDLASLQSGAASCDGVIHTAYIHDFTQYAAAGVTDLRAVEVIGATLAGSDRPFINTSGTLVNVAGKLGTENDKADSAAAASGRVVSEEATLAMAERGVRTSVMRLPPSVHGQGDHGFVPWLIAIAREKGVSAYVGDGLSRWPAVHRVDVARLYRLALESAPAGTRVHGVAEEGIPTRQIAEVIGRRLSLPVVSKSHEEAPAHFGFLGHFFGSDNPTSSAISRERFGWTPVQPGLIEDLDQPYYFGGV